VCGRLRTRLHLRLHLRLYLRLYLRELRLGLLTGGSDSFGDRTFDGLGHQMRLLLRLLLLLLGL
jgi:hypothetical protein